MTNNLTIKITFDGIKLLPLLTAIDKNLNRIAKKNGLEFDSSGFNFLTNTRDIRYTKEVTHERP